MNTLHADRLAYIQECRRGYQIKESDQEILDAHKSLWPLVTLPQRVELQDEELICSIREDGTLLTVGGVYIDIDGHRQYSGG